MRAAWVRADRAADEVLAVRQRPDPVPAAGEVRVRLAVAGINPRAGAAATHHRVHPVNDREAGR